MAIKYIGSSMKKLQDLEFNHRNASTIEGYSLTHFRKMLLENHTTKNLGTFRWLVKPYLCTLEEIEKLEGELIRKHMPEYNQDYHPERSSQERGRYDKPEAQQQRYRGVYCFEDIQ
jgi:hypothetical protein